MATVATMEKTMNSELSTLLAAIRRARCAGDGHHQEIEHHPPAGETAEELAEC
jgi:hypothetical protein